MDDVQGEIQALLREMQGGDYGLDPNDVKNQRGMPVLQSSCTPGRLEEQYTTRHPRDMASRSYNQQPLYQRQAALPLNSFLSSQENDPFDAYGWFSIFLLPLVTYSLLRSGTTH